MVIHDCLCRAAEDAAKALGRPLPVGCLSEMQALIVGNGGTFPSSHVPRIPKMLAALRPVRSSGLDGPGSIVIIEGEPLIVCKLPPAEPVWFGDDGRPLGHVVFGFYGENGLLDGTVVAWLIVLERP